MENEKITQRENKIKERIKKYEEELNNLRGESEEIQQEIDTYGEEYRILTEKDITAEKNRNEAKNSAWYSKDISHLFLWMSVVLVSLAFFNYFHEGLSLVRSAALFLMGTTIFAGDIIAHIVSKKKSKKVSELNRGLTDEEKNTLEISRTNRLDSSKQLDYVKKRISKIESILSSLYDYEKFANIICNHGATTQNVNLEEIMSTLISEEELSTGDDGIYLKRNH